MVRAEVGSSGHFQATAHDAVVTGGRMRRLRGLGRLCLGCVSPRASKTFGDRAALYLDLQRRRRRAVLVAYHASGAATAVAPQPVRDDQDCSKGSVHCAVSSSRAADAVIESTGASAA